MYCKNIFFLFFLWSWTGLYAHDAVYVSPGGDNANNGSINQPVQTLDKALSISRKEQIKTICIRGGLYYDVAISLTVADSGLVITNYKNEKVVLYGGIRITSFTKEDKFRVASLPANKRGWDFRMILINGQPKERSRLPESGFFKYHNSWNVKLKPAFYGGWERKPSTDELSQMYCTSEDVAMWKDDEKNAEISIPHQWSESYVGVAGIDTMKQTVQFTYPATVPLGAFGYKNYVVWNTRAGMTHPGQWYWDKTNNKVYYWPLKDEVINEIIVPSRNSVIVLEKGTKNVTLYGFTVSVAGNRLQNEGFACLSIDAAISGSQLSHINLEGLDIIDTGGNGIRLRGKDISIKNVTVKNCAGGGLYLSGKHITVDHCNIENTGSIFSGAIGIRGDGINVLISHCLVSNIPYSGISCACDSCQIEYCTIRNAMTTLQDGAAIYCSGHKEVNVYNNYIIGNADGRYTMGIYFDELSSNCNIQDNAAINTGIPILCHLSKSILCENNVFIDNELQLIKYARSSCISLNGNLFIARSIQCNGPSKFDVKVDTTAIDTKFRKYANPIGITSFKNNVLYLIGEYNDKSIQRPQVDEKALAGTLVIALNKKAVTDIRKLLTKSRSKTYFDKKKMHLTNIQLNEIEQSIHL